MNLLLLKMAWRNLWRSTRRTLITVSSIFFAVMLTLFFESMNYGSHEQLIRNMVRFSSGYLRVQHLDYEDEPSMDNLIPWSPDIAADIRTETKAELLLVPRLESFLLAAGKISTKGVYLIGLDISTDAQMYDLPSYMKEGSFSQADFSTVLTTGVAEKLGLTVGDTLVVIGQGYQGQSAAAKLWISGILEHPLQTMNDQFVYVPLATAQKIFSAPHLVSGILVMPEHPKASEKYASHIRKAFSDKEMTALTWQEIQPELVTAIEFDRASGRIFNGILYLVIGFGIFGTVLTMTLEREREFGGLLAVGMQRWQLAFTSFWEIVYIAGMGVLSGLLITTPMLYYMFLNPIPLSGDMGDTMKEMGLEPVLGFSLDPAIFTHQATVIFVLSVIIALYPTFRIHFLHPLEAMKR